ncbi:MAG: SH3 domain-containing protein, partial [Sphingomicrobium sp.]
QQGWMLVTLLSDRRTALVKAGEPTPIRTEPNSAARVRYLAAAGNVGRIDRCGDGWCRIEIGAKKGYIAAGDVWGVSVNEVIE